MTTQEMKLDEQWAALEFADVELQDARLNRRCQELAVALGQQPIGVHQPSVRRLGGYQSGLSLFR